MTERQNRDMLVVATKYVLFVHVCGYRQVEPNSGWFVDSYFRYTSAYRTHELGKKHTVNFAGNHKKALNVSVDASLRKLQTSYIDLLYVHSWVGRLFKFLMRARSLTYPGLDHIHRGSHGQPTYFGRARKGLVSRNQ